jgi:hypothetical protein
MSSSYIFSSITFGKWKQQARALKRESGITHTEALEQIARSNKFKDWHHLIQEAKQNKITENAYLNGLIVAYDIKDAMDNWKANESFVEDYRAWHFCQKDIFEHYRTSDEEENEKPPVINEEYRQEFEEWMNNVFFFRFCGKNFPESSQTVLRLLNERCFFAPMYIWYTGKFIEPWRDLAVNGVLDMS